MSRGSERLPRRHNQRKEAISSVNFSQLDSSFPCVASCRARRWKNALKIVDRSSWDAQTTKKRIFLEDNKYLHFISLHIGWWMFDVDVCCCCGLRNHLWMESLRIYIVTLTTRCGGKEFLRWKDCGDGEVWKLRMEILLCWFYNLFMVKREKNQKKEFNLS